MLLLFLVQAVTTPPDIQLSITGSARSISVERRGEARLEMRASPDGGSGVRAQAPSAGSRQRARRNNVRFSLEAEARIADPENAKGPETGAPQ